ncbi:proteobacterial sortase system OmpA family protein [Helicobacter pylori Hp A-17]|nr:proteobacterial sortase system OmpA family protein [Helicobacter pylori Hp A-17]
MAVVGGLLAAPSLAIFGALSADEMEKKSETMPKLTSLKLKQPSKKPMR